MKKMMKKLTAALLALTCIPVTGLTASAADGTKSLEDWGMTTWDAFEGLEPFDDHGMISREDDLVYPFEINYSDHKDEAAYIVTPLKNTMRFVLRDDVDISVAAEQMAEVLDAYFPGLKDGLNTRYGIISYELPGDPSRDYYSVSLRQVWRESGDSRIFELRMPMYNVPEDAETMEAELLLAFAKRQLISEFYGFGETAIYATGYFSDNVLEPLYTKDTDWDGIQNYLTEHYPGYTVEQYVKISPSDLFEGRPLVKEPVYANRIVPTEELTLREKLELSRELYDLFGIAPLCLCPDSGGQGTTGHNALEQPGDVTLDCEIDIVDVIVANKAILGASTLCSTAQKNCDINGDGTPDTTDALAILKEVVGLTTNFAES